MSLETGPADIWPNRELRMAEEVDAVMGILRQPKVQFARKQANIISTSARVRVGRSVTLGRQGRLSLPRPAARVPHCFAG